MKLSFLTFAFFICFARISFAQFTMSGRVQHREDNEAVVGATIYIPELRTGATTDVNGQYRISRLPKGNYTVQVSYVSHRTVLEKIAVQADTEKDFLMENASQTLEEVIVSGSSTKTKKAPSRLRPSRKSSSCSSRPPI